MGRDNAPESATIGLTGCQVQFLAIAVGCAAKSFCHGTTGRKFDTRTSICFSGQARFALDSVECAAKVGAQSLATWIGGVQVFGSVELAQFESRSDLGSWGGGGIRPQLRRATVVRHHTRVVASQGGGQVSPQCSPGAKTWSHLHGGAPHPVTGAFGGVSSAAAHEIRWDKGLFGTSVAHYGGLGPQLWI